MKRQGLKVTIGQLKRIADELERDLKETYKKANCGYPSYLATQQQVNQINIINKEGLSDTWELEDASPSKPKTK